MADDDKDLVSQIQVTGGEEAAKNIETFADRGAAAFTKLDGAAKKASGDVEKTTAAIGKSAQGAQKSVEGMNRIDLSRFRDGVGKVQDAVGQLNAQFPKLTQAVGRFAQRMALLGAGAVAVGIKLGSAARNVVKAIDGQSDALDKQTQNQIDANNAALSAEEAQINLDAAMRKLNQQLATGQISYLDYAKAVRDLKTDYQEQRRVADEVAAAQRRVKEENDRLTKSLADKKAYQGLIDTFGGPLVTSLSQFGRTAEGVRRQLVDAFGPGLAALIDKINSIITKNSGAITAFISDAGKKLSDLVANNGPALEKFFANVGSAAASIANGLIAAAPAILDLFNNVLIPATKKVAGAFETVAGAINSVFGTRLTGGSLFLVAIIAQMTGSIRILFAVLKAGGAVWKGFIGVLTAVGELLLPLFGTGKLAKGFLKFGSSIATAGGPLKTLFAVLKNGIPLIVTIAEVVAGALGVSFGIALPLVIALGAALVYLATQVDWKAFGAAALEALSGLWAWLKKTWDNALVTVNAIKLAWGILVTVFNSVVSGIASVFTGLWALLVAGWQASAQFVTDTWNAAVALFNSAVTTIGGFFTALWQGIVTGVTTAISAVQTAWSAVVTWFQTTIITPIVNFFVAMWTNIVAGVTAAVALFQGAWAAVVQFFTDLVNSIKSVFQSVADAIVGYWQAAKDKVTGFFSDLYNSAKSYLQPIIDMLTKIGVMAADTGTGSGGTVNAATGGHITGPGTGTSDSIMARLSNGEFVVKARSVAKYGTDLLHRINSGNFSLPRFATGGMVGIAPAPSFAGVDGSERGIALQPLNLSLFGEEFKGLMMPEDVGRRMTKFAVAKQTRSAGRKPAWIGRGRT
jgi:hypothetical protein